jgi:F-box-like
VKRIDVLPDEVLLEIFEMYMIRDSDILLEGKRSVEAWQSLVPSHVCQRWRSLVLESRRRLNLQLYCTAKTLARDKLDVWPALLFIVCSDVLPGTNNIIAALGAEQSRT